MFAIINMTNLIKKNLEQLRSIPVNPKYQDQMNEVISLYKSRKIENIRTAMKIALKFTPGKGSAGAAKSGIKLLAPYRTRQPATGKLSRGKMRTYFVKGTVTRKSQYISTNAKTKERKLNPKIFTDHLSLGLTIQATSKEDAEKQWKIQAQASGTAGGGDGDILGEESATFVKSEVTNAEVNFVDEVKTGVSEAHTPMRRSMPVRYGFIPENAKHQKNEGLCVVDNFVGIYGPLIKKLTREYFIEKVYKYMESFKGKYDIKDGVTPQCLRNICEDLHISMYAYDVTRKCFLKHISSSSQNYPALIYYAVGGHMYWVSDKEVANSLVKKAYDRESKIKSVALQEDWQLEIKNPFENKNYYNNIEIADLHKYQNSVIVINKKDLSEEISEYIRIYNNVPEKLKNDKVSITQFYDNINDVVITTDPNDTRCTNYETVKQICEEQNIVFKNQPLTGLVKQIRNEVMETKRVRFEKTFRKDIFEKQQKCCQLCKTKLTISTFEIDHIQALANGGSNEIDNLQILCKDCHLAKTKEEAEQGWVNLSKTESSFNSETSKIHDSDLSKVWAFVEKLHETHDEKLKLFGFDINRCRRNLMYYNKYNYPQFTVMDSVEKYQGCHSRPGKYYVEFEDKKIDKLSRFNTWMSLSKLEQTDVFHMHDENEPVSLAHRSNTVYEYLGYKHQPQKYFPLRGNGWYSQPMIEYCLENNIITEENIKNVIYAGVEIDCDYFNKLIDHYYKTLGKYNNDDFKIDKFAVNTMIGQFKQKNKEHWRSVCITPDVNNAFYHYLEKQGCFIDHLTVNETNYNIVYEKFTTTHEENEVPIYNMILELEAIELHKLTKIIESNNGKVLDLITDCVVCQFKDNVCPFTSKDGLNLDGYEFAIGVPKYKIENKEERLNVERMKSYMRSETFRHEKKQWQNIQDCSDNNFEPFVEMVLGNNMSINIDGRGGTGKSTLIRQLQNAMSDRGLNYVSLAPSNKAARLIKGETIHKFIKKHPTKIMKEINLDYIIVDEISMCHEMFYKYFLVIKKIKPDLKFIIAGNFDQLLPVNDRANFNYQDSVALHDICDGNRLNLSKCRRSDDVCFRVCSPENIPNLTKKDFGNELTDRHLSFTNKTRIAINKQMMDKMVLHKKSKKSLNLDKLDHDVNSQDVRLLSGTPIIARVNNEKLDVYNNECYTIKEIQHSKYNLLIVDEFGETKDISFYDFQKLFYVAYCITIHKSQGSTFDHPYTIHDWHHKRFDNRLKYVALSRTTKLENINII